jgi:AraC-like DNA-binding protein
MKAAILNDKPMNDASILMKTDKETWASVDSMACDTGEAEKVWYLPRDLGSGQFITQFMEGDLTLTVSDIRLNHTFKAHLNGPDEKVHLVFSLKGRSMNTNRFFKHGFEMRPGVNILYWSPDRRLLRQAAKGEALKAVVVSFPKNRLGRLGNKPDVIHKEGALFQHPNSPAMNMVLHQILSCRYSGRVRQLFLESKALELMALKWSSIEPVQAPNMPPEQARGVEKVRALLLENIQDPPSIHRLARIAGMSHPVLNRCFKRVTGCSVFEFLRQQRLELSREMVTGSTMSMTEIAHAAGYASSSHFSRAFMACYGLQPSRYRKMQP